MKAQSAGGTGGKSDGFGPNSEDISPLDPGSSRGAPGVGNRFEGKEKLMDFGEPPSHSSKRVAVILKPDESADWHRSDGAAQRREAAKPTANSNSFQIIAVE